MIVHRSHPARDGIDQIIWRLSLCSSVAVDVGIALAIARLTKSLIEQRAIRSGEMLAHLGYRRGVK